MYTAVLTQSKAYSIRYVHIPSLCPSCAETRESRDRVIYSQTHTHKHTQTQSAARPSTVRAHAGVAPSSPEAIRYIGLECLGPLLELEVVFCLL